MAHKSAKTRSTWGRGGEVVRRGLDHTMLLRAESGIEELIRCNGFWEGNREQFAIKMGWPSRRTVEDVQRLTQDQERVTPITAADKSRAAHRALAAAAAKVRITQGQRQAVAKSVVKANAHAKAGRRKAR